MTKTIIFTFILLGISNIAVAEQPVTIGIIEETCGDIALSTGNFQLERLIRVLFEKRRGKWLKAQSVAESKTWVIAFDGKKIGEVSTKPDQKRNQTEGIDFNYQKIITPQSQIPQIKNTSTAEGRFMSSSLISEIKYRPLIVVDKPQFTDPDQWKPRTLSSEVLSKFKERFSKAFPKATECDPKSPEKIKMIKWNFKPSDVIVLKTYGSKDEKLLIKAKVSGWNCGEFFELDDSDSDQSSPSNPQWFYFDSEEFRFLGGNMNLVDSGDYDADGKSELLFQRVVPEKPVNSYLMYSNDFSTVIDL